MKRIGIVILSLCLYAFAEASHEETSTYKPVLNYTTAAYASNATITKPATSGNFLRFEAFEYFIGGEIGNSTEAEIECTRRNAHLAVVNTKAIRDFLVEKISEDDEIFYRTEEPFSFLIGLRRISNDHDNNSFVWANGDLLSTGYSDWADGAPFESVTVRKCVVMGSDSTVDADYKWRDVPCYDFSRYICQRVPEGSTTIRPMPTLGNATFHPNGTTGAACGGTFHANSSNQDVSTPSLNNLDCFYVFVSSEGFVVEVELVVHTELCCDYVEVFDGDIFFRRIMGNRDPIRLVSSSQTLTLYYHADFSEISPGVQVKYQQIASPSATFPFTTTLRPTSTANTTTLNVNGTTAAAPTFPTPTAGTTPVPTATSEPSGTCPPGAPMATCSALPCFNASCPGISNATCKNDYCGGCFARFFDEFGNNVTQEQCNPRNTTTLNLFCPQVTNVTNACSRRASWLCEYIRWRVDFLLNWQQTFEEWRMNNPQFGGFATPRQSCLYLSVTCKNSNQLRVVRDFYQCQIPYCADGQYVDGPGLGVWQADQDLWQRMYVVWKQDVEKYQESTVAECKNF